MNFFTAVLFLATIRSVIGDRAIKLENGHGFNDGAD